MLLRGHVTSVVPSLRQAREIAIRGLHAVHGEQPRGRAGRTCSTYSTGPHRGGVHAGFQAPSRLQRRLNRPAAVQQELDLLRRFPEVNAGDGVAAWRPIRAMAVNSAGDTEYGACGARLIADIRLDLPRRASIRRRAAAHGFGAVGHA